MFYSGSQQSWQGARSQNGDSGALALGTARVQSTSQERLFSTNSGVKPFGATVGLAATPGARTAPAAQLTNRPFSAIQRPVSAPTKAPLSLVAALAPRQGPQHAGFAPSPGSSQHLATQAAEHQMQWSQPNMLGTQQDLAARQPLQPRPGSANSVLDQLPLRPGSAPAQSSLLTSTQAHRMASATQAAGTMAVPAWNNMPEGSQQTLGSMLATELDFKRTTQALEALQTQVRSLQDSHSLLCAELSTISRQYQELSSLQQACKDITALMQGMEHRLESHMQQTLELHSKTDDSHQVVVQELHAAAATQQQFVMRELQATHQAITTYQEQQQKQQQVAVRVCHEAAAQTSPGLVKPSMCAPRIASADPGPGANGVGAAWQQRHVSKRHSVVVSYTRMEYQEEEEQHVETGAVVMGSNMHYDHNERQHVHETHQHHHQQQQQQQQQIHHTSRQMPPAGTPAKQPTPAPAIASATEAGKQVPPHMLTQVNPDQPTSKAALTSTGGGWVQRKRGIRSTPGNSTDGSSDMHGMKAATVAPNHQALAPVAEAVHARSDAQASLAHPQPLTTRNTTFEPVPVNRPPSTRLASRSLLPGSQSTPGSQQHAATQLQPRSQPVPARMPSIPPAPLSPAGAATWLAGAEPAVRNEPQRPFSRAIGSLLQPSPAPTAAGSGQAQRTFSRSNGKLPQSQAAQNTTPRNPSAPPAPVAVGKIRRGDADADDGYPSNGASVWLEDHGLDVDDQELAREVAERLNRHRMRKLRRL